MLAGVHHVALVTRDLDRLVAFYTDVFGAHARERSPRDRELGLGFVEIGADSALHVFERPGGAPGGVDDAGAAVAFARGRVGHVSLRADGPESCATIRERLVARGATDGEVVDFGPLVSLFAVDPDGAPLEVTLDKPPGWAPAA